MSELISKRGGSLKVESCNNKSLKESSRIHRNDFSFQEMLQLQSNRQMSEKRLDSVRLKEEHILVEQIIFEEP